MASLVTPREFDGAVDIGAATGARNAAEAQSALNIFALERMLAKERAVLQRMEGFRKAAARADAILREKFRKDEPRSATSTTVDSPSVSSSGTDFSSPQKLAGLEPAANCRERKLRQKLDSLDARIADADRMLKNLSNRALDVANSILFSSKKAT